MDKISHIENIINSVGLTTVAGYNVTNVKVIEPFIRGTLDYYKKILWDINGRVLNKELFSPEYAKKLQLTRASNLPLIKAFEKGEIEIQCKGQGFDWRPASNPTWSLDTEYRQKPEERKYYIGSRFRYIDGNEYILVNHNDNVGLFNLKTGNSWSGIIHMPKCIHVCPRSAGESFKYINESDMDKIYSGFKNIFTFID